MTIEERLRYDWVGRFDLKHAVAIGGGYVTHAQVQALSELLLCDLGVVYDEREVWIDFCEAMVLVRWACEAIAATRSIKRGRRGRKNDALRDLFLYTIRHGYFPDGRPGAAWKFAFALASIVWPKLLMTRDIRHDLHKRRRQPGRIWRSAECIRFLKFARNRDSPLSISKLMGVEDLFGAISPPPQKL